MDKVKITQEQADSIEDCLNHTTAESMLKVHRFDHRLPKVLNDLDFDELAKAIYIGYEVEETPEDKVREYYLIQKAAVVSDLTHDKPTTAIRNVLDLLNIKVAGVNHE